MSDHHLIQTIVRRAQAGADHRLTAEAAASLAVDALAVHLAGQRFSVTGVSVARQQAALPKTGDVVACSLESAEGARLRLLVGGQAGAAYAADVSWSVTGEGASAPQMAVDPALPPIAATRTMRMDHCDQAGHVNVQVFLELVDDAIAALAGRSGLWAALKVIEARVQFKSELFCGDAVVVRSGVRQVSSESADIVHGLFHLASGRLAAVVETRCGVASAADLAALGALSEAWAVLPAARPPADPRPPGAPSSNAIESCRATIDAWDVDPDDNASMRGIIQLCSTGARQFLGAIGLDGLRFAREKITVAAVDYLVSLPIRPRLGQNVVLRTVPLGFSAKSMRFCHYILDADTGAVFGTVEIVGVMLDLATHQSTTIPTDVADTLKRLTAA
ncbi:acyl-CoA thioesterase [Phreatobacter aquaticus]|uniref:acyl-CoA thioesterase n=1 Tax=Phreatobacter aquaticus TaxID=2570229 RepID=UPI00143DF2C2|nr:thioesterase family protein [Phreatobacter aquaticus]